MRFVAVTSCPTGIAHTYMAAEALEQAGRSAGHEVVVETQGAAGADPVDPAVIAAADGAIFAADLEVRDKGRFAGLPVLEVSVKRAVADAPGVLAAAVATVGSATGSTTGSTVHQPAAVPAGRAAAGPRAGTRVRQWLMTGVSHMIPFVAAGGIMIALSYLIGGFRISEVRAEDLIAAFDPLSAHDWAGVLFVVGSASFGFLVPVLAGFIGFAVADRPGIAPGFVGGAVAVTVGAGFLGGLVAGFLGGFTALALARLRVPTAVRGVMPVVVIPLIATSVTAGALLVVLGRPLRALMDALTAGLNSLTGSGIVLLGVVLGAMMAADLGGPINKVAYTFATTGLATVATASGDAVELRVMAACMAAGMTPPLGMALATFVRRSRFSAAERENGKAAVLLGAFFITEGAIPFAATAPLRTIPAVVLGSGLTGGLVMAFGNTLRAPHGGVVVFGLVGHWPLYLLAVLVGTAVTAAAAIALKGRPRQDPPPAATAAAPGGAAARSGTGPA
ncbi:PTS fructose transporter subunit IIC [Kineococcus sp. SYSU DK006]|uniref:PTS fructose transporter subunit IIC n=1 Tax=Kineococcus sp. SYSU DK006 TaxID=3383127 RepID=UPI003D7CAA74